MATTNNETVDSGDGNAEHPKQQHMLPCTAFMRYDWSRRAAVHSVNPEILRYLVQCVQLRAAVAQHLGTPDFLRNRVKNESGAVRKAVGGGCQSGWGRLLRVTNAIEVAVRGAAAGQKLGTLGGGGGWTGAGDLGCLSQDSHALTLGHHMIRPLSAILHMRHLASAHCSIILPKIPKNCQKNGVSTPCLVPLTAFALPPRDHCHRLALGHKGAFKPLVAFCGGSATSDCAGHPRS